ncbi:MAG: hypothetical protein HUJ58_03985 [Erysipelotrichaceae bacterium]|nr:hypothetical protein [Erysipelotrichaceae bacterium]
MFTIIICLAFSIVAVQQFTKPYFDNKKAREQWNDQGTFTVLDQSKSSMYVYIGLLVLAVVMLGWGIANYGAKPKEMESFIGVGILLTAISIAKMLASGVFHKVWYNDTHFGYCDTLYRIKSIKGFAANKKKRGSYDIMLYTGKNIVVPKKLAQQFMPIVAELTKKK